MSNPYNHPPKKLCPKCERGQRMEHRATCRLCYAAYQREWRKANPRPDTANDKVRATAGRHKRSGFLLPKPCADCGRETPMIQMHHEDYNRPLAVTWLCTPCHQARHRRAA